MNEKQLSSSTSSMSIGDIWYVLFRHKWKILIISVVGIAIAVGLAYVPPGLARSLRMQDKLLPMYASEAQLLVKYVAEARNPADIGDKDPALSRTAEGEGVMATELQILTSMDLAMEVATNNLTPAKILGPLGGGTNQTDAALAIRNNLKTGIPKYSKVIQVRYEHPDRGIAWQVLKEVVDTYLRKHEQVHSLSKDFDEALLRQRDELRRALRTTEDNLRNARTNIGLLSLEDAKRTYSAYLSRLQQTIFDTEMELIERGETYTNLLALLPPSAAAESVEKSTNSAQPSRDVVNEYRRVNSNLETLAKREQDLLAQFTPESSMVKTVREQIADAEKIREKLEGENPALVAVRDTLSRSDTPVVSRVSLAAEQGRIAGLQLKLQKLNKQMTNTLMEARQLPDDVQISEWQRQKEIDEANYKYLAASVQRSQIDEALASGRVLNINVIQSASPPTSVPTNRLKIQLLIGIGSLAAAIALAFLIEMYLDQSLRRPSDIQVKVGLPLFLTVPRLHLNGKAHLALPDRKRPLLTEKAGKSESGNKAASDTTTAVATRAKSQGPLPPWDPSSPLNPFSEALRDRLMTWFELNNLTHKPKLVAITSCAEGSGVSTVAAGLAASLSETGDGNVLLVDMNQQNGAAHQFHRGDLAVGIDEALELERRNDAKVQDNLYVVSEAKNEQLPAAMPKRFKNLVPRLKASDYDYIIFDMPPVSQISLTPRLARFMDMVLMVVESEQTDKDVVKRASAMLAENKAPVGVVLNKARNYVPQRLQQTL